MRCPKCGSLEDKVIDSRLSKDGESIRRRRECLGCEVRFTTYEQIERLEMRAIKRDGRHEPFDRQKLLGSIAKACEKRPIGVEEMNRAADEIIQNLESMQFALEHIKDPGLEATAAQVAIYISEQVSDKKAVIEAMRMILDSGAEETYAKQARDILAKNGALGQ